MRLKSLLLDFRDYEIEILQTSPASESPADNPLYRAFDKALKQMDPKAKMIPTMLTGATDSRYFRDKGSRGLWFPAHDSRPETSRST